jgi:hypothetical protein
MATTCKCPPVETLKKVTLKSCQPNLKPLTKEQILELQNKMVEPKKTDFEKVSELLIKKAHRVIL